MEGIDSRHLFQALLSFFSPLLAADLGDKGAMLSVLRAERKTALAWSAVWSRVSNILGVAIFTASIRSAQHGNFGLLSP